MVYPRQLRVDELDIETGIVDHQRCIADKGQKFFRHRREERLVAEGLRRERVHDTVAILHHLRARGGLHGRRRGGDVAVHVAARGQRGEQAPTTGFARIPSSSTTPTDQ